MELLFVRHGQTDWNARGWIQGQTETSLNHTGRVQARQLAHTLLEQNIRPSRLYTSPQRRAMETARILADALELEPIPMEGLREISFGIWEGNSWKTIQNRWPEEFARYQQNRFHISPPGGESYAQLLGRVLPDLRRMVCGGGEGECCLAVAHSAVIKAVLCQLYGVPFSQIIHRFPLRNAHIVRVSGEKILTLCEGETYVNS